MNYLYPYLVVLSLSLFFNCARNLDKLKESPVNKQSTKKLTPKRLDFAKNNSNTLSVNPIKNSEQDEVNVSSLDDDLDRHSQASLKAKKKANSKPKITTNQATGDQYEEQTSNEQVVFDALEKIRNGKQQEKVQIRTLDNQVVEMWPLKAAFYTKTKNPALAKAILGLKDGIFTDQDLLNSIAVLNEDSITKFLQEIENLEKNKKQWVAEMQQSRIELDQFINPSQSQNKSTHNQQIDGLQKALTDLFQENMRDNKPNPEFFQHSFQMNLLLNQKTFLDCFSSNKQKITDVLQSIKNIKKAANQQTIEQKQNLYNYLDTFKRLLEARLQAYEKYKINSLEDQKKETTKKLNSVSQAIQKLQKSLREELNVEKLNVEKTIEKGTALLLGEIS